MGVVGIDIDGVIAENPWKTWHWPFSGKPVRNRPIRVILASPYYIFRCPRREARQWVQEQQTAGNEVLLISGIYGIVGYFILIWLKLWRFPFNGLYLQQDWDVPQPEYKAKIVHETGCQLFIDDRFDVIEAIAELWRQKGLQPKFSQNGLGYVVSIKGGYQ